MDMQNIIFNQANQKRSQISPSTIFSERIESCRILEVTDDEGELHFLVGIKYTVIVADTVSPILTTPHSTSLVLWETRVPIQDRGVHAPLYLTRQGIFMYLNSFYTAVLVV